MAAPWVPAPLKKPKPFTWRDEEQRKLHELVNRDCRDMDEYAKPARDAARVAIQGYMALTRKTYTNRSDIFPPTIHAILYSRIAMEAANVPRVEFKARKKSSEPKMKTLNAALRNVENGDGDLRAPSIHQWFHQNFDKILFGVGFRFQGYHLQTRLIHIKDEQGKWKQVKSIVHDDIIDLVPDFFHVGVSRDAQPGLFGASSCYWDRFYTREGFLEAFDTPYYQNIEAVTQSPWYADSRFIRVRFYWNLHKDLYYVQALPVEIGDSAEEVMESAVPIREDYILDYGDPSRPKKFLPISSIHNDQGFEMQGTDPLTAVFQGGRPYNPTEVTASSNKSFWSKSDPLLAKSLIAFQKSLWGAAADHVKASSVHFLLSSNAGVLDQINTGALYGIMPLRGDPNSFDVKSLTENSAFFQKWAEMEEAVKNTLKYSLGNDYERAAVELTNEKATVAAIRQQVQRLRSDFNLKFNTGPIQRHYRITCNLIQQYYPEPTLMDLADGEIPEGTDEEDVIRDQDGYPIQVKKRKEIPLDSAVVIIKKKDGKRTLVADDHPDVPEEKKGAGEKVFTAYEEFIRTEEEPDIYIEPGSTFAELKALERSLEIEKMNSYQFWLGLAYPETDANGAQVMKPLIPREGAEHLLEKFAEKWDDDPEKLLNKGQEDVLDENPDDEPRPAFGQAQPAKAMMGQGTTPQMQPTDVQKPGMGTNSESAANLMQEATL